MSMSETIADTSVIVAVDRGPDAARAVRWASRLAGLQGRALVLADTGRDDGAEERLRAAADLASEVQPTSMTIADSLKPAEALVALASPRALLVVGAHHVGRWRRGLKRPISESVVRHARCPVVVVHPDESRQAHHGVVVGVVDEVRPDASLRFAYDYASWTGTPLTVLHCFWDVTHRLGPIQDLRTAPNEHRRLAEAVAGLGEDYPDVRVRLRLAQGFPERLLVDAGRQADLLVIGTHHPGWFDEILEGSVEHWVLTHAACDVALVPELTVPAAEP